MANTKSGAAAAAVAMPAAHTTESAIKSGSTCAKCFCDALRTEEYMFKDGLCLKESCKHSRAEHLREATKGSGPAPSAPVFSCRAGADILAGIRHKWPTQSFFRGARQMASAAVFGGRVLDRTHSVASIMYHFFIRWSDSSIPHPPSAVSTSNGLTEQFAKLQLNSDLSVRQPLLAMHGSPGAGKSRMFNVLSDFIAAAGVMDATGTSSTATAVPPPTALAAAAPASNSAFDSSVWASMADLNGVSSVPPQWPTPFHANINADRRGFTRLSASNMNAFRMFMSRAVPILVTFNDKQPSRNSDDDSGEAALALRLLHSYFFWSPTERNEENGTGRDIVLWFDFWREMKEWPGIRSLTVNAAVEAIVLAHRTRVLASSGDVKTDEKPVLFIGVDEIKKCRNSRDAISAVGRLLDSCPDARVYALVTTLAQSEFRHETESKRPIIWIPLPPLSDAERLFEGLPEHVRTSLPFRWLVDDCAGHPRFFEALESIVQESNWSPTMASAYDVASFSLIQNKKIREVIASRPLAAIVPALLSKSVSPSEVVPDTKETFADLVSTGFYLNSLTGPMDADFMPRISTLQLLNWVTLHLKSHDARTSAVAGCLQRMFALSSIPFTDRQFEYFHCRWEHMCRLLRTDPISVADHYGLKEVRNQRKATSEGVSLYDVYTSGRTPMVNVAVLGTWNPSAVRFGPNTTALLVPLQDETKSNKLLSGLTDEMRRTISLGAVIEPAGNQPAIDNLNIDPLYPMQRSKVAHDNHLLTCVQLKMSDDVSTSDYSIETAINEKIDPFLKTLQKVFPGVKSTNIVSVYAVLRQVPASQLTKITPSDRRRLIILSEAHLLELYGTSLSSRPALALRLRSNGVGGSGTAAAAAANVKK